MLAWLELGDSEALYLESSEDFEVTTNTAAKTVQAKAGVSRSLTLRSEDVIDAFNHYWELTTRERRTVRFVLLAQAEAGVERDAPFGAGIAGLKVWQNAGTTRQPEPIERLQRFLRDDPKVAPKLALGLREFVRRASPAEFCARLLEGITFDLGHEPTGTVQQLVKDRLIVLAADRHGASVAEAERVADTLFANIVHLAAKKEQVPLTRGQLLRVLEEQIVKHREHLRLALPSVSAAAAMVDASGALWEAPSDELRLPLLPVQVLQRSELVGTLRGHLEVNPLLVLFGSTGMGKTTLAKQVAAAGKSWCWLDLQGCPAPAAQAAFRRVLATADRHRNAPLNLVLDALSPEGLPAAALNTLRAISFLVQRRGGCVIITTQRPLMATEVAGMGWTTLTAVTAPRMDSEEITRFATELGCVNQTVAKVWGMAVHAHTDGHPQLVHAACLWLKQQGWPKFDGQAFRDSAATVDIVRAQARRLVARLSSEELELLSRLSVLGSTFRREHALALAEKLERLPGAQFRFESLIGPWIEPGDARGYHRLSPLLHDRNASMAPERRSALETACALVRLQHAPVYVPDAALALRHAFNAANAQLAGQVAAKFLLTPKRARSQAYWHLLWLTGLAEGEVAEVFSGHPTLDSFIHLLRFQVAAELLPEHVGPFIAAAEKSLSTLPAAISAGTRFVFLCEILITSVKSVPPREALRYIEEATALSGHVGPEADVASWFPRALLPPALRTLPLADHVRVSLAALVLSNTPGREIVSGLMDALEALPEERRRPLTRALGAWPTPFFLVWDKVWLLESEKPVPNWEGLLVWFAGAVATGLRWKSEEVVVAAARATSIVCNEYLNDFDRAERALAGIEATQPAYVATLFDQRAKIAAQRKKYPEALAAMREALPRWDDSDFGAHGKMLSLQRAGVWAGKLEQWKDSAGFFTQAGELAQKSKQLVAQAGFETDTAVALWRAKEKKAALAAFARAIDLCGSMRPALEDLPTFQFQKLLGHIILTFAMEGRRSGLNEPQAPVVPGMASEPTVNDKVKTLPPPRPSLTKVFLAMLEHNHQLGEACWERYRDEAFASRSVAARQFVLELEIRKAIRRGTCAELPALAAQQASVFAAGMKLTEKPEPKGLLIGEDEVDFPTASCPFDHDAAGSRLFLAGLVSVTAQCGDISAALAAYEANAGRSPFPDALRNWVQRARSIAAFSEAERLGILYNGENPDERVVAGLTLLIQPKSAPETLWSALYLVASSLNRMWWGADVMLPFDKFAGERWRAAAKNRAMFRNPTLWLPDLQSLCGEPVNGNKRFARLMLAALPALHLDPGANIVEELQQMRDGTLDNAWQRIVPRLAED